MVTKCRLWFIQAVLSALKYKTEAANMNLKYTENDTMLSAGNMETVIKCCSTAE